MAANYMKCENYKDLQVLILKQIPKPKNNREKEHYQKEQVVTTEKAKMLWEELLDKNKKFYERDGFLNIEYLSDKKQYRRKPLAKGRPKKESVKEKRITIRMDHEITEILNNYCQTNNKERNDYMEAIFTQIINSSPILGVMLVFWYFNRQDYKSFVDRVQAENANREKNYQDTITTLSNNLNIVKDVQQDIEEIKYKLK